MSEEPHKILVVDDSPQICKALSDVLTMSGYSVRTAPSAERALQIIEAARFDLVITDLKMTGLTGMDLAKKIFVLQPGTPVVILTGYGDMDSVIGALRSGVADYLKKPFSLDEVLSVVQREIVKSKTRSGLPTTQAAKSEKPPRLYIFGQRDLEQIDAALSRLRAQATAESAMLVEQAGYVIAAKGRVSGSDLEPLSNLIADARSNSASLASLLGETQDFATSYMEGQRMSVYTTSLGRGLYLVVIVTKNIKQGLVSLYAKEAVAEIDKIVQRATESMQRQLGHPVSSVETAAMQKDMAARKVENVFEDKAASTKLPIPPEMKSLPATVSTIKFKKDQPAPHIVSGSATAPASAPSREPGDSASATLSFEEAMRLGLHSLGPESAATTPEPEPAPASPSAEGPAVSFEEALRLGLLNFGDEQPAPQDLSAPQESSVEPESLSAPAVSFEEALQRGLLDFGGDKPA